MPFAGAIFCSVVPHPVPEALPACLLVPHGLPQVRGHLHARPPLTGWADPGVDTLFADMIAQAAVAYGHAPDVVGDALAAVLDQVDAAANDGDWRLVRAVAVPLVRDVLGLLR